jgi:hypothetical protein
MCEIWGYHGCVAEDISGLECEAELLGEYFPTFRKIIFRFELSVSTFIYLWVQ